jgi:hypothetical protein
MALFFILRIRATTPKNTQINGLTNLRIIGGSGKKGDAKQDEREKGE